MSEKYFRKVLQIAIDYDLYDCLFWNNDGKVEDIKFFIRCNDVFYWGCSDLEEITEDSIPILKECMELTEMDGAVLYCAKMRKLRPQGAFYKYIEKENIKLFNECGPEREIDFVNPEPSKH